ARNISSHDAVVYGPSDRRDPDRRCTDLLPRPQPGSDSGTPADGGGQDFLKEFMATMTPMPAVPEVKSVRLGQSPMKPRRKAIWELTIVRRALWDAILKLNPRKMMGNPVMFVVEIGSVVTTVLLFQRGPDFRFNLQITLWLWFTVLFA